MHHHSRRRATDGVALDDRGARGGACWWPAPIFGIEEQGIGGDLKSYVVIDNHHAAVYIISELSRTLALAVRLFGNMMSGSTTSPLLTITPFIFPIAYEGAGLLTCMVQADIFSILAAV